MRIFLYLIAILWFVAWIVFKVCENPSDRQDKFMNEGKGD